MYFSITGLDSTIADNILMRLKAARQYLKTDFKIHTASESLCADHCRVFVLSRTETEYKGQCQHQHTITCDRCEPGSESLCADHCRVFVLSRTETEYKGQCQHQHTITCDRCEPGVRGPKECRLRSATSNGLK